MKMSSIVPVLAILIFSCSGSGQPPATEEILGPEERVWLLQHPDIRISPDPQFPPIEFVDSSGAYRGLVADYFSIIQDRLQYRFHVVLLSNWDEVMAMARTRGIDAITAAQITPDRSTYLLYTKQMLDIPNVIIGRDDTARSLVFEEMAGMRVAVTRGNALHEYIQQRYPAIIIVPVKSDLEALEELSFKHVDATVMNLAIASYLIEKHGFVNLRVVGDSRKGNPLAIASRNDWPMLNQILEKGLAAVTADERRSLYRKWVGLANGSSVSSREFWRGLLLSLTVASAVLFVTLLWVRTLRRLVHSRTAALNRELVERVRVENALRESEERWQHALEGSGDGVWDWNVARSEVYFSRRWKEMLGYLDEEIGNSQEEWSGRVHPDDAGNVSGALRDALEGRCPSYISEHRMRCKDGSYKWILARGKVIVKSASGEAVRIVGTQTDISERKKTERELLMLAQSLRSIGEAVSIADRRNIILFVNRAFEEMYGYDEGELIGQPISIVRSRREQDLERVDILQATIRSAWEGELYNVRKDGTEFPIFLSTSVVRDEEGVAAALIGVARDITESKNAADKIKASLAEKEILLKEIHHRVKNNLQVISSLLNLQANSFRDAYDRELSRESQNRIRTMALIHEQLYQSADFAHVDFAGYLDTLSRSLFHSYTVSDIKLVSDVENMKLSLDTAIPCGLIVNELISNALKHAFPSRRKGVVMVRLHPLAPGRCELIVADDGVGFPKEFDFKSRKSLGLELVNTLVDQINGTMEMQQEGGTAVRIVFPLGDGR